MTQDPARPSGPDPWRLLSGTDAATLAETRLTLHHAAQLLASFGQALVEPRADDSHRSMTWDAGLDAFRSESTPDGLRTLLTVPDFTLALWRDGRSLAALALNGRTLAAAERWLGDTVAEVRTSAPALTWPEYDLPERVGGRDAGLAPDAEALEALAAWYGNASTLMEAVARNTPEASVVRCWPHHFDLATLLTFPDAGPDGEARYVGLGLSPGDASRDRPYFYVNGWPPPTPADLAPLTGPGSWNTEGWVGAVLAAAEIVAVTDPASQRAEVEGFIAEAVAAMSVAVLGKP